MKRSLLLLLAACSTSERPEPLPLDVEVTPIGTSTLAIDALHLAVAYRTVDGFFFTNDVAVTATGTPILLTLAPPPIQPIGNVRLAFGQNDSVFGHRPRFVTYLDRDGSGSLDLDVDLLLGVTRTDQAGQVAWIFDLDAQLYKLEPEAIGAYYRATGDRYSAFLHVSLLGLDLFVPAEAQPIIVDISSPRFAPVLLACGESVAAEERPGRVHLLIDDALELGPLCEVGIGTCESVDVATLAPIEMSQEERTQCSRRGGLEAFVRQRQISSCDVEMCRCELERPVEAIITSTSALPPWWPCGDEIEYCDVNGPIYLIDPACD